MRIVNGFLGNCLLNFKCNLCILLQNKNKNKTKNLNLICCSGWSFLFGIGIAVMVLHVILQIDLLGECLVTQIAFDFLGFVVHALVLAQIGGVGEAFRANVTGVVPFVGVRANVHLKEEDGKVRVGASRRSVRSVYLQRAGLIVVFRTVAALKRTLLGVNSQM